MTARKNEVRITKETDGWEEHQASRQFPIWVVKRWEGEGEDADWTTLALVFTNAEDAEAVARLLREAQ